jgi:hypothetical protein
MKYLLKVTIDQVWTLSYYFEPMCNFSFFVVIICLFILETLSCKQYRQYCCTSIYVSQ